MFLLPKGNPLYENIPAAKIKLPEMLDKLKNGSFTGYLNFTFPASGVVLFFEGGKLISALLERGTSRQTGFEAMAGLCNSIMADGGSLNVYRLSKDLTMGLHALLHGEMLYRGQEVKLIDIKGLLEKVKAQRLNGCLRIYTADRSALIFYKEGSPLGFFHDGTQDIDTSATESQKIAGLPGAKIDVLSTQSADELMHYDLLEMVNIDKLWGSTESRHAAEMDQMKRDGQERDEKERHARLRELEEDLKEVAAAYLGKMGRVLVEKELGALGGRESLQRDEDVTKFMTGIEKGAKLLTSLSKLKEMAETMKNEIVGRAKG
jgi:hypothetical protein